MPGTRPHAVTEVTGSGYVRGYPGINPVLVDSVAAAGQPDRSRVRLTTSRTAPDDFVAGDWAIVEHRGKVVA
jgi:hypothetical protein